MQKPYNRPLSAQEIAALPDSEIDYSDIPELDYTFWLSAKVSPPRIPMPNISLRLSQEVLDFFKTENPKGYTAKMASVLATYVQAHQQK